VVKPESPVGPQIPSWKRAPKMRVPSPKYAPRERAKANGGKLGWEKPKRPRGKTLREVGRPSTPEFYLGWVG